MLYGPIFIGRSIFMMNHYGGIQGVPSGLIIGLLIGLMVLLLFMGADTQWNLVEKIKNRFKKGK